MRHYKMSRATLDAYQVARLSDHYLTHNQQYRLKAVETQYLALGQYLLYYFPLSKERTAAISALSDSLMWASKALFTSEFVNCAVDNKKS